MMDSRDIAKTLHQLDIAHQDDRDGGYALVGAIREWARTLNDDGRQALWNVLLELVAVRAQSLWGTALEVLVQENPEGIPARLGRLLELNHQEDDWKDQIVLALLRVKHRASLATCIKHINEALNHDRREVLPLLAALVHSDVDECISIAAKYFGRALASDQSAGGIGGYIPAFVRNFVEVDGGLLCHLVDQTRSTDISAGSKLSALISDCLAHPVYAREIGKDRAEALKERLSFL